MTYFPYDTVRPEQDRFIKDVEEAVRGKSNLIAHAPTGLGKTAAALSPALEYALKNGKKVFFLTSRNTQHNLAVDTLQKIKNKHNLQFSAVDMIGKNNMCAREEAEDIKVNFYGYCNALKNDSACTYYEGTKSGKGLSGQAEKLIQILSSRPTHSEETKVLGRSMTLCPYEVAAHASGKASVVISDYNYIFYPYVREAFFERNGISLEDVIVIIDEGHNLPDRIREMFTVRMNSFTIERALNEAYEMKENDISEFLKNLEKAIRKIARDIPPFQQEMKVKKECLMDFLSGYSLETTLKKIREMETKSQNKEQSSLGLVAEFLEGWVGESDEEAFLRSISTDKKNREAYFELSSVCLDPSKATKGVIERAHSVIMMSGTLHPLSMFKDILGFPEGTAEREYRDPMPKENKLSVSIGGVTTKYQERSEEEYRKIGDVCSSVAEAIPGNTIVFFQSYNLMKEISPFITTKKTVLKEESQTSKQEKEFMLSEFKKASPEGNLMLAVMGANFSEGIDLPGDFLKGVVIVGLPLIPLDLKTKSLISYYDKKHGKGWDYGYFLPAFTRVMQAAGRCIRTETDRGVIAFIEKRYLYPNYKKYFPSDFTPRPINSPEVIEDFFRF